MVSLEGWFNDRGGSIGGIFWLERWFGWEGMVQAEGVVWLDRLFEETDGLIGGDGVTGGLMVREACLYATVTEATKNV